MPISACHAVPEPFRKGFLHFFLHFILLVLPGSEDEDGVLDRPAVGGVSWRHKEKELMKKPQHDVSDVRDDRIHQPSLK